MKVAFRVDASYAIGSGHVVRCLTLAQRLADAGHSCLFLGRAYPGHLMDTIERAGFPVAVVDGHGDAAPAPVPEPEARLPDWERDAALTAEILAERGRWDWLVVDHYGLDAAWERELAARVPRILVINDLLGRDHHATLLLDQTLGRGADDYRGRVNPDARLLLGTDYAVLRDQFRRVRAEARRDRFDDRRGRLMIGMGGIDLHNLTGRLLSRLATAAGFPDELAVTVVLGARAPRLDEVRAAAAALARECRVLVDVADMAGLMSGQDLAIGAAGITSWERCCVGLPAVVSALAENQRPIAAALRRAGAARYVEGPPTSERIADDLVAAAGQLLADPATMRTMSDKGMALVDGRGAERVMRAMSGIRAETGR